MGVKVDIGVEPRKRTYKKRGLSKEGGDRTNTLDMKGGATGSGRVLRWKRKGKGRISKTMFENAIMKPTLV